MFLSVCLTVGNASGRVLEWEETNFMNLTHKEYKVAAV